MHVLLGPHCYEWTGAWLLRGCGGLVGGAVFGSLRSPRILC